MAEQQKENKKLVRRLRNKYRLVIINDDTFAERFSVILSPLNVASIAALLVFFFVLVIFSLIAYTPLREFIPGYADVTTRKMATYAAFKVDSLEQQLGYHLQFAENIRNIVQGNDTSYKQQLADGNEAINPESITYTRSKSDSALRKKVEEEEKYSLVAKELSRELTGLSGVFFFNPVEGRVTGSFDVLSKHYGVDIATKKDETVLSVLDGTVTLATWIPETGHVIQIQHKNNLISVYKHNSVILKQTGDQVRAGEAIAIVGNSGEHTTGPHLHFELWLNGNPINPQDYIIF